MANTKDLVAGAAAAGHGILTGWHGRGNMTRREMAQTISNAGFPSDWCPEAKSAHAQAGRLLDALPPQELNRLVEEAIVGLIDRDAMDAVIAEEQKQRDRLNKALAKTKESK